MKPRIYKLTFLFGVLLPAAAWGQASPQAEALFRDGKRLLKEGKVLEACAAFEGSERAEHNLATLLSLADCHEKNHQIASAWASFLEAERQTRGDPAKAPLNTTARTRARALEPRLSYLTINVPDGSRVADLVVVRDGVPLDPAAWNRAIPVDGGDHAIGGRAPGHEPWSTTLTLAPESDKQVVEVPRLVASRPTVDKAAHEAVRRRPAPVAPSTFTTRRWIGIGFAAGGVVPAGVASYLGLQARNLRDEAVSTCPPSACTTAQAAAAQDKNDLARTRALYANIGFGVAGAAVVTGVVLWFVGDPERPNTIAIAPIMDDASGLAVVGRF